MPAEGACDAAGEEEGDVEEEEDDELEDVHTFVIFADEAGDGERSTGEAPAVDTDCFDPNALQKGYFTQAIGPATKNRITPDAEDFTMTSFECCCFLASCCFCFACVSNSLLNMKTDDSISQAWEIYWKQQHEVLCEFNNMKFKDPFTICSYIWE